MSFIGKNQVAAPKLKEAKMNLADYEVAYDQVKTVSHTYLKAKIFTLREWYSCRGLALVANSGISTLGLNWEKQYIFIHLNQEAFNT